MTTIEKILYYLFNEYYLRMFNDQGLIKLVTDFKAKTFINYLISFYKKYGALPKQNEFDTFIKGDSNYDEYMLWFVKYPNSSVGENFNFLVDVLRQEYAKVGLDLIVQESKREKFDLPGLTSKVSKLRDDIEEDLDIRSAWVYEDIDDRIQRIEDAKHFSYIPSGLNQFDKYAGGFDKKRLYLIFGRTGTGKCFAKGTKILMYDGSIKNVEDVVVGDQVMGDDGTVRNVTSLGRGREQMYKVIPNKGESWVCNKSHILVLKETSKSIWRHGVYIGRREENRIKEITVEDYVKKSNKFKHVWKMYRAGVEFKKQPVAIDPYFYGLWLGDGSCRDMEITNVDDIIVDYLYDYGIKNNLKVVKNGISYSFSGNFKNNELRHFLRGSITWDKVSPQNKPLDSKKFIRKEYLINSREVRLKLLAGLIDSDGSLSQGCYDITTKFDSLKDDILFLCRSLGYAAYAKKSIKGIKSTGFKGEYWRISISGELSEVPVLLPRKKAPKRKMNKDVLRTGFKLERLEEDDYYGFTIDGNNRFLLGDFTVTHNTRSLFTFAYNLSSQGYAGLYFTFEMPIEEMNTIYDTRAGSISWDNFKKGTVDMEYYKDVLEKIQTNKYPLKWAEHTKNPTIDYIQNEINEFKRHRPLDFIVVDYLGLMYNGQGEEKDVLGEITRKLKNIAKRENIVVLTAQQANRKSKEKGKDGKETEVGTENISGSDKIGANCDFVAYVYQGKLDKGILNMDILKNRCGPKERTIKMLVDFPTNTIKDAIEFNNIE